MRVRNVNIIAAVGNQGQLGLDGSLPWPKQPDDMLWFRELTTGGALVCGKSTFQTIKHLDATHGRDVFLFLRETPIQSVLNVAREGRQLWICGGVNIYNVFLPYASRLHVGLIDYNGPADRFFPAPWSRMPKTKGTI